MICCFPSMKEKITRTIIFAVAGIFRWFHRYRGVFVALPRAAGRPLVALVRFFARHVFVFPYRLFLVLRRLFRVWGLPAAGGARVLLSYRLLAHLTIIAVVLAVGVTNVSAAAQGAASTGENSVLFALAGGEDDTLEDVVDDTIPTVVHGYYEPDAVSPPAFGDHDDIGFDEEALSAPQFAAGDALVQPPISEGAPSVAPRTRVEYYVVRAGDTAAGIASRFGVSINTILWENKLTIRSVLQPGDRLAILPTTAITHTVRRGDTVQSIAKQYGSAPEKILAWNPADLRVGDKVMVPDGTPPAPPAPPRLAPVARILRPANAPVGEGRMVWPTAWRIITQYFRWRHSGIDIDGDYTTPIYAADAGVVIHAGWGRTRGGYGIYVDIDHGNGLVTRYGHASKLFVSVGDPVARGQSIAMVGTTGRSTGTHLHFEVIKNGRKVNPLEYVR